MNDKIKDYWKQLHQDPSLRSSLLPQIEASWERSYTYGVSSNLLLPPICSKEDLDSQPNLDYMIDLARPLAKQILDYLADEYAILLFGERVALKEIIAQDNFVKKLKSFGVTEGASFAENVAGTNAASLGVVLAKPVQVVGYENFCRFGIEYGASFAPIIDRKKVIGGIAIIGPVHGYGLHLLGLAAIAASFIESRIGVSRWDFMLDRAINEGILAIYEKDKVFWMSKTCHRILKYPEQRTYNLPVARIIDPSKLENQYFWNIIRNNLSITDKSVTLMIGKELISCNMTISNFESTYGNLSMKVVIIQDVERINRLICNYFGNSAKLTFEDIIGSSPVLSNAVRHAKRSADTFSNILLLGESGTGKDVMAQAIHNESARRSGPFVAINCAALPRELIASELFGYNEGAFTGAKRSGNIGKFELAHQGTIFLDEIGDMPMDLQAMLLRVIEEKNIVRLGGNKPIPVNVRIIAATNKDLEIEIERNCFRRDLYYRLGVIKITVPPLRERLEDIAALSQHFINILCRGLNIPKKSLAPDALHALQQYRWLGNIRELQNVLESAVQWSSASVITKAHIEQLLPSLKPVPLIEPEDKPEPDVNSEIQIIKFYLEKYDNNKSKTAKALGISRKALYKRLKKYSL
jgi:transcriptional regulator with PAS, ATPase and Fis domain